jgi:putative endonuclease
MATGKSESGKHSRTTECKNDWCVYVLLCRGNYLYIGLTNNLDKRLKEHAGGTGSKFVRSRRPFALIKTIPCANPTEARSLEANFKKLKRSRKIEVLGLSVKSVKK